MIRQHSRHSGRRRLGEPLDQDSCRTEKMTPLIMMPAEWLTGWLAAGRLSDARTHSNLLVRADYQPRRALRARARARDLATGRRRARLASAERPVGGAVAAPDESTTTMTMATIIIIIISLALLPDIWRRHDCESCLKAAHSIASRSSALGRWRTGPPRNEPTK